jgi:hemerythrin-like domain-containing protein
MPTVAHPSIPSLEEPIANFSDCHKHMLGQLRATADLPRLILAATRARSMAADIVHLFEDTVLPHHLDEEKELFPAVQRSAAPGEEAQTVKLLIERLLREHRNTERLWKQISPGIRTAARGGVADVDPEVLDELMTALSSHAKFEEENFLPLAHKVLSRNGNHMDALGVALHLRHTPTPTGYI